MKLCNKKELPEEKNQFLVDRYLTLNILNHVPIPAYDKYKTALQDDVNLITDSTQKKELKSFNLITLKQSMEVYKIYQKYEETFQKIMNGDYDDLQNKTAPISSFDLLTAIHNGFVQVIGKKNKNSNWDLDIIITDRYDFTVLQKIAEYVDNGILSVITATANNFAMIATSCNVVHEYNIVIKFQIKDWK